MGAAVTVLTDLLVYTASVWGSCHYADRYWVVGPLFGAAVMVFDSNGLRSLRPARCLLFIVLSTLIYALVYRISRLSWGDKSDLFEYFIGSFQAAVVTGSVLMSAAHTIVFGTSRDRLVKAILGLTATFYLVVLIAYVNDRSDLGLKVRWLSVMIAVWQGYYLYAFFGKGK